MGEVEEAAERGSEIEFLFFLVFGWEKGKGVMTYVLPPLTSKKSFLHGVSLKILHTRAKPRKPVAPVRKIVWSLKCCWHGSSVSEPSFVFSSSHILVVCICIGYFGGLRLQYTNDLGRYQVGTSSLFCCLTRCQLSRWKSF